uniref:Large ribosomal subunit protein bL19 n=1 Tax=candidate division WOR-3 bacterium TaxID=2052148 RepID=A0A7C4CEP5_UNCW3
MAKKKKTDPEPKPTPPRAEPAPGDLVDVHVRVVEGDKERTQTFRGTVIAVRGSGAGRTFTVRRVSRGVGIERIFPFGSPAIVGIDIRRQSKVRRAKLYYLRGKAGREAVLKERKVAGEHRPGPATG